MTRQEKAELSRGYGRFVYLVFDKAGKLLRETQRPNTAYECRDNNGGHGVAEVWLGGKQVG